MATRVIDDTKLNNIAVAIQAKDGGGQMTVDEMPGRIEAIPTGSPEPKTVNFYDFKGNLAHSYTAEEVTQLTGLPEAPVIEGFTFQHWNYTLQKVKAWVQNHDAGELAVVGLYVTSDGHTRIKMRLREAEFAHIAMPFCIQKMTGTVVINWGDNSEPETITAAGIYSHLWQVNQYPADIIIDVDYMPSDLTKLVLGGASSSTAYGLFNNETYYASCVTEVEYGENCDFMAYSATFKNCTRLKSINIPYGFSTICTNAFQNCINLVLVALPDGTTNIGDYAFSGCTNLNLVILPDSVTGISPGAFSGCTSLALTALPDSVTSIDNYAFQNCTNLVLVALPDSVTNIGGYAFSGCTSLALTVLPDSVTNIGVSAFSGCTSLALTVLPDSVTSIDNYAFQNCTNLVLVALPDSVTNIGGYAFSGCTSLYVIDLTTFTNPQSVPTLVNANGFQGIPALAEFWFSSQEELEAFAAATNWSTLAGKFVNKGV